MRKIGIAMVALLALASCTTYSLSPPLNTTFANEPQAYNGVYLSSGTFVRPHRTSGVLQLTQTGYKWMHEIEVVGDANPASILFKISALAESHGAQGIQNLVLIDLDPQTALDKISKQTQSIKNIQSGQSGIAEEGTKTRWEVRGEMVVFIP